MDKKRLRIAIQKTGRLADDSMSLLRAAGLSISRSKDGLFYRVENLPVDLLLVRDDDIPRLIGDGIVDLGIVGRNVLEEYDETNGFGGGKSGAGILCSLGFSRCRLAIAVPESVDYGSPKCLKGLRIATTYPGLLGRFLKAEGIDAEIVGMHGSVEVAPRLGVADAICDLVATGSTLEANGLKAVETVLECEALLVGTGQPITPEKQQTQDRLLARIDGVLASRETKYIMLNAPLSALPDIKKLLPGSAAPTVIPLDGSADMVALHAVCRESVFWETLEDLKGAGASAILVVPIEKMMV